MKKKEYIQPQMEKIEISRFCEGEELHPSRPGLTDFDANTGHFDDEDDGFTPVATSLWD